MPIRLRYNNDRSIAHQRNTQDLNPGLSADAGKLLLWNSDERLAILVTRP